MGGAPAEEGGDGVNLCPAVPTHLVDIVVLGTDRFGYREREREGETAKEIKDKQKGDIERLKVHSRLESGNCPYMHIRLP